MNEFYTVLHNFISVLVSGISVTTYHWNGAEWIFLGSVPFNFAGSSSSARMVAGVALLVRAFVKGRAFMGAKYLSGFVSSALGGDNWHTDAISAAANFVEQWTTSQATSSGDIWQPGIWSRKVLEFYEFNAAGLVRVLASYQRRRKPGVGFT